ncbi:MAG: NTP transferase domain-containing protein [Kiloniellales bacterium]
MKGIVIAAGRGARMDAVAKDIPKCLLPVAGRPLIEHTIERLRHVGCGTVVVVTGYLGHRIDQGEIVRVENQDYLDNNILHSFMCARDHLAGPVIATYSDIWVEPTIYRRLVETPGDIVLAVDTDWRAYYEGRTDHPVEEAENVFLSADGAVLKAGKHLDPADAASYNCGEFLGLWRMSAAGAAAFRNVFEELARRLDPLAPFHEATEWRQAYITDMIQELVNRGIRVDCALVERGWAELDTPQDYQRLASISARQRLFTIVEAAGVT